MVTGLTAICLAHWCTVPREATRPSDKPVVSLDYRHFIESLKRKPQAFRADLRFRDELFPA